METENIFDRLSQVIEKENLNISSFSKRIGVGDQTIRSIIKHRRNFPGYEVLLKTLQAFECIDANWLLAGKGEMLKQDAKSEANASTDGVLSITNEVIVSQQRTIENLSETIKNLTTK